MRYRNIKQILLGLVISAVSMSVFSACGDTKDKDFIIYDSSDDTESEAKTNLSFFGFKADAINLTAIENAMQDFMSTHKDININYEGIKGSEYWDVFDKRDKANVLDDIFMIHHDQVVSMSAENKLADLSDLPGLENYTNEAKAQFTDPDGSVYFLPTLISTYNLYINYDLLDDHGQKIPENWKEFQSCCDYFVSKGIVPIIANNRNSLPTLISGKALFDTYQQTDVADTIKKFNENPAMLAEVLAPGVEMAADMLNRGWFDAKETLATEQTSDDLELFLKGDRPFMITGGWASVRVIAQDPSFSYGVYPYPILDDGSVLSIQMDTCMSVNAKSENLAQAKEFVAHMIQPDVMWAYCDSQASYSPMKEEERRPSEETLIPSAEYLYNGRIVFRSEYRLNLPTEDALFKCSDVLLNGGSVTEAKAALAKALSQQ